METKHLTVELIERALKAWKRGQIAPIELLELDWLQLAEGSNEERLNTLRDAIYSYILQSLGACRVRAQLPNDDPSPPTLETLKIAIARDFASQYSNLEVWSALYYQYVEGSLNVGILVEAALRSSKKTYQADEKQFRRRVIEGLQLLRNKISAWELEAQRSKRRTWLPSTDYDGFLDPNHAVEALIQLLIRPSGGCIVSVEGLGGIGKTALVRQVAEQIATQLDVMRVIWISARSLKFNPFALTPLETDDYAARSRADVIGNLVKKLGYEHLSPKPTDTQVEELIPILNVIPTLVVIDNLESLDDSRLLIPDLRRLQGPTCFLLTSRDSMVQYDGVFIHTVDGLPLSDSHTLIERELKRLGTNRYLTEVEIRQIYDVVGGVPLALKLIAAQLAVFPTINEVLEGIQKATPGKKQELMFDFIYRRTWRLLKLSARQLLLAIYDSVSAAGEELDWIERMAQADGLTEISFKVALEELHFYALLEVNSFRPPLYSLHQLTVTFLKTNIAQTHWVNNSEKVE